VSGFDTDVWILWALRAAVWMTLLFVAILGLRMLWGMHRGNFDVVDLVTGPGGRLSNMALGYFVGVGVGSLAVLRDAADGTVSWEVLAVYLGALGLFDVGKRGLNVLEIIKGNGHGNHKSGGGDPPAPGAGGPRG
jgi:hypothetical protein